MPRFHSLTGTKEEQRYVDLAKVQRRRTPRSYKDVENKNRGCENCPLDGTCRKVINVKRIEGKKIFILGLAPSAYDTHTGQELTGKDGVWFWEEMEKVGLTRDDCDVQNLIRCRPTEEILTRDGRTRVVDREPTKEEVHHCSIYTERALAANKNKAKVFIILGQFAAKAFLSKEFRKDRPVFWSEKLQAQVFCVIHPKFFVHAQEFGGAPKSKLLQFRDQLKSAARMVQGHRSKFAYVESQDYKGIFTAEKFKKELRKIKKSGEAVAVDIEDDELEDYGQERKILCVGFSYKKGRSRTVYLYHPPAKVAPREAEKMEEMLIEFLEDPKIKKIMQHGSYDANRLKEQYNVTVRGYDFDTQYAEYLSWSHRRSYSLAEIAEVRFPSFAGYKEIITPYVGTPPRYSQIPTKIMTIYNGADADLTKRIESTTKHRINLALLKVYVKVAFVTDRMEKKGFEFDKRWYKKVVAKLPERRDYLLETLRKMAKDKTFNPASPPQVKKAMYVTLKIPPLKLAGKKKGKAARDVKNADWRNLSTDKTVLDTYQEQFPFCKHLNEYRALSKMISTYLEGFMQSAKEYGTVRTKWWLTGTITGRLRSGGSDEKAIVNLQNIHGSPMIKNLLVSTPDWRDLREAKGWSNEEVLARFGDMYCYLAPDYSQIEIRVLAEISGDKKLIQIFQEASAFKKEWDHDFKKLLADGMTPDKIEKRLRKKIGDPENYDPHCMVGHQMTGWDPKKIKADESVRKTIKNIHFGLVYGLTEDSLPGYLRAKGVEITDERAAELHRAYFRKFKTVGVFIAETIRFAERKGYVESMFGFRREIAKVGTDRGTFWGNQSVNSRIQSSAHTYLLIVMAMIYQYPERYNRLQQLVAEIHDALYMRVKLKHLSSAFMQSKQLMETDVVKTIDKWFGIDLKIPLEAEAKAGFRLGAMIGYDNQPANVFVDQFLAASAKADSAAKEKYLN